MILKNTHILYRILTMCQLLYFISVLFYLILIATTKYVRVYNYSIMTRKWFFGIVKYTSKNISLWQNNCILLDKSQNWHADLQPAHECVRGEGSLQRDLQVILHVVLFFNVVQYSKYDIYTYGLWIRTKVVRGTLLSLWH